MYALVVRFEIKPDCVREFDELVEQMVPCITASEPGTLAYMSMRLEGQESVRVFIEVYRDEEAFLAHEQQPHTRLFLEAREPMLASVRVERLSEVVGKFPGDR
jgi:quinol monooxygenase YgiN